MKSFRQIQAVFLILLLSGSFFLHTFVPHSSCCGVRNQFSVRNDSVKSLHSDSCTAADVDFFCPVCAGMLNADQVPAEPRLVIPIGQPVIFSAFSESISTPDWLLPSPRAPPAIISSHIG